MAFLEIPHQRMNAMILFGDNVSVMRTVEHSRTAIKSSSVKPAKFDKDGYTPLMQASWSGNLRLVRRLVSHGAAVDVRHPLYNTTALYYAVRANSPKIVKHIIRHGARINIFDNHGETPLHYAATSNATEAIRALLAHGARLEPRDRFGQTPFIFAACGSHLSSLVVLWKAGADIESKDCGGHTALMSASFADNTKGVSVVRWLLKAGAKVNTQSLEGNTALYEACIYARSNVISVLLEASADPNIANKAGVTPLMRVCGSGDADVIDSPEKTEIVASVAMLIAQGADIWKQDGDGKTALDYAIDRQRYYVFPVICGFAMFRTIWSLPTVKISNILSISARLEFSFQRGFWTKDVGSSCAG